MHPASFFFQLEYSLDVLLAAIANPGVPLCFAPRRARDGPYLATLSDHSHGLGLGLGLGESDSACPAARAASGAGATVPALPAVALLPGLVFGGGAGIAMHCPHRVAGPGAVFSMPEVRCKILSATKRNMRDRPQLEQVHVLFIVQG